MWMRILLVASLLLNVSFAWFTRDRSSKTTTHLKVPAARPAAGSEVPAKIEKLDWRSVESADYKQYIANLRSVGCPEETIFDIIVADVNTLFAMKARAQAPVSWNYWQPESEIPSRDELRKQKVRRELEKEKRALLSEILGPAALERLKKYQLWGGEDWADQKLAFLDAAKRARLKEIEEKFFDREQEIAEYDANGVMSEAMVQALVGLQKERRTEIESLLSKEELRELDLRTSEVAQQLRGELQGFHPSEAEFRSLYESRESLHKGMHETVDIRDPATFQKRLELQEKITEQMRNSLGEERYKELLRSQDIDYQTTLRLARYFSLPDTVAADVYQLKQTDASQAEQILQNSTLSEEDRLRQLAANESAAETQLKSILGERVFDEYKQANRWWMRGQ